MKFLINIIIVYFLYSLFLIIKDKYNRNVANGPLNSIKYSLLKRNPLFTIIYRPIEPIHHRILTLREEIKRDKLEKESLRQKRKKIAEEENKQEEIDLKKSEQQEKYIKNYYLIEDNDGITPIKGNQIGKTEIDKKNKIIKIQIKQVNSPTIFKSFEGLMICKNCKHEIGETEINGGVFEISKIDSSNKYKIFINNNRQGIKIECSEIELRNCKNKNTTNNEHRDLYVRSLYGGFFSLEEK